MKIQSIMVPTCVGDGDEIDNSRKTEIAIHEEGGGIRVILDPHGEDHDILIEQYEDHWRIYVHPGGGDAACLIRLRATLACIVEVEPGLATVKAE